MSLRIKRLRWFLLLFVPGIVIVVDATKLRPVHTAGSRVLHVEPENNEVFDPRTNVRVAEDASGGGFISIEGWHVTHPHYGRAVAGETGYRLDAPAEGTYRLWLRCKWGGVCANSVTVAVTPARSRAPAALPADHERHLVGNDLIYDRWHWVRGPSLGLQRGANDVFLGTRESGAAIDCIVFSSDDLFEPSAEDLDGSQRTPAEHLSSPRPFADNFSNTPGPVMPLGHDWLADESTWQRLRDDGLSAAGPVTAANALAQARVAPLESADMECSLKLSARPGGGLFFGRTAPGDYFFVRLAGSLADKPYAGRVQIGHQSGDATRILAEETWQPSEWTRLSAWFSERFCRVSLDGTPVTQASLPRSAMGSVGLYVDGSDPAMKPSESVVALALNGGTSLRLADHLRRPERGRSWPGLAVLLPGPEISVLRWTNLSRDWSHAKRVELVRKAPGAAPEPVGERWGVFGLEDRASLEIDWRGGTLRAAIGAAPVGSHPVAASDEVRGGLVVSGRPRAFFGDFSLQPLEIEDLQPRAAPAGDTGAEVETRRPLGLEPFLTGVLTSPVAPPALPCGWVFYTEGEDSPSTLRISDSGDGRLALSWAANGRERTIAALEGTSPSSATVQVVFDIAEILVLVDGRLVLADARSVRPIRQVDAFRASSTPRPPRMLFTALPDPPGFFGLGAARPASEIRGTRLHGDAILRLGGASSDHLSVRLHADGAENGGGYELEVDGRDRRAWRLLRNGEPLRSGTLEGRSGGPVDLKLAQRGSVLMGLDGPRTLFVHRDPQALRAGRVAVLTRDPADAERLGVVIQQAWDVWCVFHQDLKAMSSFALWKEISGRWSLDENDNRTNGYLLGAATDESEASIAYKGKLDARELLTEIRLDTAYLQPGHRFSIHLDAREDERGDTVVLRSPGAGVLEGALHRGGASESRRVSTGALQPALAVTVLRTGEALTLDLDHVPFLQLDGRANGPVRGLRLGVGGPPGHDLAILSIGIQENPLAAPRIPAQRRRLLDFLRLAAE